MLAASVVIPTYNRMESLATTLKAFARQTLPCARFEVVVVSDGSTDGTNEMLHDMAGELPYRLLPLAQTNAGPAAARNLGVRSASNEIIVLTDDDMEPLPGFLEAHIRRHELDPDVVVIGPMSPDPARAGEEPVWIAWEHVKLQEIYDLFRPGGMCESGRGGPWHFYSGNASVRREHMLAVGGFDERFRRQEDVELAVRLERDRGVRFLFDFETDAIHRPTRTFESWLRIPRAYGELDAKRIKAGTLAWEKIASQAASRNPATRALARLCETRPRIEPVVVGVLRAGSSGCWSVHARGPAIAALSALYNSVYWSALRHALRGIDPAAIPKACADVQSEVEKPRA